MKLNTTKGTWNILGINLIASDSISCNLKDAIEAGNLEQSYLQKLTGNFTPILVDKSVKEITFLRF